MQYFIIRMENSNKLSNFKQSKANSQCTMVFGIGINLMWAILYTIYLKNVAYDSDSCGIVVNWNKAIMITCYIGAGFDFIRLVISCCSDNHDSDSNKLLTNFKLCSNGIANITILIGTTTTFTKPNMLPYCQSLNNLNLGFVIAEWTMTGIGCCFIFLMFLIGICGAALMAASQDPNNDNINNNQIVIRDTVNQNLPGQLTQNEPNNQNDQNNEINNSSLKKDNRSNNIELEDIKSINEIKEDPAPVVKNSQNNEVIIIEDNSKEEAN